MTRSLAFAFVAVIIAVAFATSVSTPQVAQAQGMLVCNKIKDGTIFTKNGTAVTLGYDQYGYNYQAHIFNGLAENYSRPTTPVTEGTENLVMKWSDDWLANVDCNGDNKLDRGLDLKTGSLPLPEVSRGWCTNHYEGDYLGSDGEMHHYTYFAKIVWVGPALSPDPWAATRLWGQYAVIEELQNDPFGEYGGRLKMEKLVAPGLGLY